MNQKDYWNGPALKKEFTTPFDREAFERHADKTDMIIDVGCGYGRILEELKKSGYENLIGFDIAEKMVERAKNSLPGVSASIMKPGRIPMGDGTADAVILFAVLTCIRSSDEQKILVDDIKRVLKPGGILYVNDFLLNTDERNTERYEKYSRKYSYGVFELPDGGVLRHHDEKYIRGLLSDFETLEYERLVFRTMNGNTSKGFYHIGRKR